VWSVWGIVSRYRMQCRRGRWKGMSIKYKSKYEGRDAIYGKKVRKLSGTGLFMFDISDTEARIRFVVTFISSSTTKTTIRRAPLPFQCAPKSQFPITGYWDEKKLEENYDTAFANQMGRVDVEGKLCISLCRARFHECRAISKHDIAVT
jgi:hypothetical protein